MNRPFSLESAKAASRRIPLPLAALITLALLCCVPLPACGQEIPVPVLSSRVTDQTGTLAPAQRSMLEARLKAFEDSTSNQVVVLMIPTLGSESLEDFSLRVAESNKIGLKDRNNGVLVLIAKNDHRIRFEVGYGLEGALPDALSGQIVRREMTPRFRQDDYFGGISAGIDAVILATKGEYKAEKRRASDSPAGWLPFVVVMVIILVVLRNAFRPRRRFFGGFGPTMWGGPFTGGGWGGGSGGGGFGGGGFSGGGGSFGGGGASGSW
jgi:uncharacterized protein